MGFFLDKLLDRVNITNELIYRHFGYEIFRKYGYFEIQNLKEEYPIIYLQYKARALKIEEYDLYRLRASMAELEVKKFIKSLY